MTTTKDKDKENIPPVNRELSCFFVREFLPLYLEKRLDNGRHHQVSVHLKKCHDCTAHLEKLTRSRDGIAILAGTQVAPQMINYLKEEHHFWLELFGRWGWRKWPATTQWITQLTGVALVLILGVHYFPWVRVVNKLKHYQPTPITADAPVAAPMPDQGVATSPVENSPVKTVKNDTEPAADSGEATDGDEKPPTAAEQEEDAPETAGVAATTGVKTQGYVWRGSLKVEEISDELADRVTKTIEDLGGTKAGQVELGWRQGKQRYYHFILPDENYEKFLSVLNAEGLVQLTKEKHPRVIKQGHMRIIMTIDEAAE